jgi:hypothetical protein
MNIKIVRIIELLIFRYICSIPEPKMLLIYNAVMYIFIEILNYTTTFKNQKYYKYYNALFVVYQLFCVANRSRNFRFSTTIEEPLNIVEHFLFANIICLLVSQVYAIVKPNHALDFKKNIIVLLIFNIIGFFNEIFQNWISVRPLRIISAESWKDIAVNLFGSLIFLGIGLYFSEKEKVV